MSLTTPVPRAPRARYSGPEEQLRTMQADALAGLRRPQKGLPCKYFYDEEGSRLFDQICHLPEYYLTRAEQAIMEGYGGEMAAGCGTDCALIEYGSGSSTKTRLLLDQMQRLVVYVPVDISEAHLLRTAAALRERYPRLAVLPVVADFTAPFPLPEEALHAARRVCYFPGSTIGNFDRDGALRLLRGIAARCGPGGKLLLGVDLKKDRATLERAYNDAAGVTAAFNLNLLVRLNREIGADFQLDRFRHHAIYNAVEGRIEMYLVSLCDQLVQLGPGAPAISLREDEAIRTECSYKYAEEDMDRLAECASLVAERRFTDAAGQFLCVLYRVRES